MKVNDFYVSLRHTAKVEIDPDSHDLPPDWGPFEEFKVADYFCPEEWSNDGFFVPVEEGMPLWIDLRYNQRCACVLSVQRFNPVSNEAANLEEGLKKDPKQNYMVLPDQKWIDGYTRDGKVYQFVVTKAGEGLAVNEYVLPKEMQDSHAIGIAFFLPKNPSYWPDARSGLGRSVPTDALVVGANRAKQSYTSNRISNPMWFSPIHTPQNWQIRGVTKGAISHEVKTSATNCISPQSFNCALPDVEPDMDMLRGEVAHSEPEMDMPLSESICADDSVDMLEQQEVDFDKASMGAGGRIDQEIVTDSNTVEYYQEKPSLVLPIYLALPEQFKHIMDRGKRQDANREDKYIHSGDVGCIQIPLIK